MKTAVVLFNLGGPDSLAAVKPFLFNLFNDPAIIGAPKPIRYLLAKLISSRREKKAQAIYAQMGGRSPILPQTQAQADALQKLLNEGGDGQWRCFIAMRYWNPRAAAALREVIQWGPDRVVLLPLYPQFSTTTTGSSLQEWRELAANAGFSSPATAVCCYHSAPDWIAALAEPTRSAIARVGDHPMVLFSAHGLPQKVIDAGDPYQWQVEQTVAMLRQALVPLQFEWVICYQSRVGPLQWIGPSTDDCIRQAAQAGRNIVVVPVAFVSEHSETLVELDIEYRHLAESGGAKSYTRVATTQVRTRFITQLAQLARRAQEDDTAIINGFDQPPHTSPVRGLCPLDATECPCRRNWRDSRPDAVIPDTPRRTRRTRGKDGYYGSPDFDGPLDSGGGSGGDSGGGSSD
jgi:ferrochelatase